MGGNKKSNKLVGAHLSISKGIFTLQKQMNEIDANTCALFVKNQRRYISSNMAEEDIKMFKKKILNPEILLPHGSYLINLASTDQSVLSKSKDCLLDDLERCDRLGIKMYNLHPGSDVNKKGKSCLKAISTHLNEAMDKVKNVTILLENMAGQGNVVGSKFEELRDIIEGITNKDRIGVCLDTCHMFGAGYDIRTEEKFKNVMKKFDDIVGLKYLKAMHLNDSKEKLGSKKDRHECIGEGEIGIEAFKFIMKNDMFNDIPLILETPVPEKYKDEIKLLKSFCE